MEDTKAANEELKVIMAKLKSTEDSIGEIETTLEDNNSIMHGEFSKIYNTLQQIEKGVEEMDSCMGDNNNVLNIEFKQVYKKIKDVEKSSEEFKEALFVSNTRHETEILKLKELMDQKFEKLERENKDKDEKISLLMA